MWDFIRHLLGFAPASRRVSLTRAHARIETDWAKRVCAALCRNKLFTQYEQRMIDGTRVDLLMDSYAVEIDWAHKWAEGVGQALYYGCRTSRHPAVLLLLELDHDAVFVERTQYLVKNIPVSPKLAVWWLDTRTGQLTAPELSDEPIQVDID